MKDFVEITCPCGLVFKKPYSSMQNKPSMAPSFEEYKSVEYMLLEEFLYHQNKDCTWMWKERKKLELATMPKPVPIPKDYYVI